MKTKKSSQKQIEFDLFENFSSTQEAQSKQPVKNVSITFNFDTFGGELESGFGFKDLEMPTNYDDVQTQTPIEINGQKVFAIWPLRWYNQSAKAYEYYVVYFNDANELAYANLFDTRQFKPRAKTQFTKTPVGNSAQFQGNDALVFSTDNLKGVHLISGTVSSFFSSAPSVISVCAQQNNLFAITTGEKERLLFSENKEITKWDDESLQEIELIDDIGRLNKVVALNDYVFVLRDFGINKVSFYSTRDDFDVSKIYQSDSFINPTTIASSGDKIYFIDRVGLCAFNGSSVSRLSLGCEEMLAKAVKKYACAACFEGKYFLACRYDFDDGQVVGCESEEGFKNNCLFIFDLASKKTNLIRGVDISGLCVLNNPYLSKIVACFNGQNIGKIGELCHDGKIFGQTLPKVWTSVSSDFGSPEKLKVLKYICFKCNGNAQLVLKSERGERTYEISGSDKIQRMRIDLVGKEISLAFRTTENITISNVKLGVNLV